MLNSYLKLICFTLCLGIVIFTPVIYAKEVSLHCSGTKKISPESTNPHYQDHSFIVVFDPATKTVSRYDSSISKLTFISQGRGDHVKKSYSVEAKPSAYSIAQFFINYDKDIKMVESILIDTASGDTGGGLTIINGVRTNTNTETVEQFRGVCRTLNQG
ncbi:hypothetical protein [Neptuniibacter sp. QD48_11]|uniref:hypothetical protein n=1 Tax=Neptuniibacter sp. QD48_11 TaxID=3398211 RepID=UPI0039F5AFB2